MNEVECGYQFTMNAVNALYDTVDHTDYQKNDAQMIYYALCQRIHPIGFCEYLKRYIYQQANMTDSFSDIPLSVYQEVILEHFAENKTPFSFHEVSTRPSVTVKNWLTKKKVSRDTVLLLGFGLKMSTEDINLLLLNGLHDYALDSSRPLEAICLYCYQHAYSFDRFRQLHHAYEQLLNGRITSHEIVELPLPTFTHSLDEKGLLTRPSYEEQAYATVETLFESICRLISGMDNIRTSQRRSMFTPVSSRATEADIERILYSSVARDTYGNILPTKKCHLPDVFLGKRLSRQHLSALLMHQTLPDRYDIITLHFLEYALSLDKHKDVRTRYLHFVDETNDLLASCHLGEIYVTEPYESFICMCMLTEDPLVTFNEVIEFAWTVPPYELSDNSPCPPTRDQSVL